MRTSDESDAHAATAVAGRRSEAIRVAVPAHNATTIVDAPVAAEGGRLEPGQRIGRYEVITLIGRGGMGEVYAAHDVLLDRPVALKVLLADNTDAAAAARLVREAQALARLQHPNVVAVFDAGEDHGLVFLAMQYVEGETLAMHLYHRTASWREIVALYVAAGRGLAAAHAAGIVHRDFKPSNVLVDRDGKVAVTDFGVARAAEVVPDLPPGDTAPFAKAPPLPTSSTDRIGARTPLQELTHHGALIGTPPYMAREQFHGSTASPATDQYAYACSLWESLFRSHPYLPPDADGTLFSYAAAIETGVLRIPKKHAVPRRVVAALARALEPDPARRWPSMGALLGELELAATPRRWPWIAAGASFAVVGAAAAILLAITDAADPPCDATARQRIDAVWGPAQAGAIQTAFGSTPRTYATTSATQVTTDLGRYATAWQGAVTDACVIGRRDPGMRRIATRRLGCLDRALAAFAATVTSLATAEATVVDYAHGAVDALPSLAHCSDDAVGVAATPPPDVARRLDDVEARLEAAIARNRVGQFQAAHELFTALRRDTTGFAWEPFQVRLAVHAAFNAIHLGHGSHAEFVAVAKRARAIGAHRIELGALLAALRLPVDVASHERVLAEAQAAASRIGGNRPALEVTIAQGRGYAHMRHFQRAASLCRDGLKAATTIGWTEAETEALNCLSEALLPLGLFGELEGVIERNMAISVADVGADHPTIADLLVIRAEVSESKGKFDDAKADLQRALDIRLRTFGERDVRVARAKTALADLYDAAGDTQRAIALTTDALAIVESHQPPDDNELLKIHRNLGIYAMTVKDRAAVRRHFDLALEVCRRAHGERSIDYAYLLLMYGQYQTAWDLELGFASLRQAVALFEAHNDPRANIARATLANSLEQNGEPAQALPILEAAVAKLDVVNTPPTLAGQIYFSLARSIVATRGDKQRARELADDAIGHMLRAGNNPGADRIRAWAAKAKLPPSKKRRSFR